MSLTWNIADVANHEALAKHPSDPNKMHPVLNAVIWKTLAVDMGTITKANAEEFFWRVRFLQRFEGEAEIGFWDGRVAWLTLKDITDCIGLRTNVTTIANRTKWLAKFANERHYAKSQQGSAREVYDPIAAEFTAKAAAKAEA